MFKQYPIILLLTLIIDCYAMEKITETQLTEASVKSTLKFLLQGHTQKINSVAISSNGSFALTGSDDCTARLWFLDKDSPSYVLLQGHAGRVIDVTFSPNDHYAVTISQESKIRLWDISKTPISCKLLINIAPTFISFNQNSSYLLVGPSKSKTAYIWNLNKPEALPYKLEHKQIIRGGALSADGKFAITSDYLPKRWNGPYIQYGRDPAKWNSLYLCFNGNGAQFITISSDNKHFVSISETGKVELWDIAKRLSLRDLTERFIPCKFALFSPNGLFIFTANKENNVYIYDISFNKKAIILTHESEINAIKWCPGSCHILIALSDGTIRYWHITQNPPNCEILRHNNSVLSIDCCGGGCHIISCSENNAYVWDVSRN